MKRILISILIVLAAAFEGYAQTNMMTEFADAADSLVVLLKERTSVSNVAKEVKLERILKRGNSLDFYFSRELGDYPWRKADITWFRSTLKELFPEKYSSYQLGSIYAHRNQLGNLTTPALDNNGSPSEYEYRYEAPTGTRFVEPLGGLDIRRGMAGRTVALWQSHGRYFDNVEDHAWKWQRAPLHTTVEDIYTQSYVLPFLIPMLENAGAYVMTPRERDTQARETITDNDPSFSGERTGLIRTSGKYSETGKWENGGIGFADRKARYELGDNPFTAGSFRKAAVTSRNEANATVRWEPNVPERGIYSIYISYASLNNSSECAHYTVHHMGGENEFSVNQKIGGGTWIYLGSFELDINSYVELDNKVPQGKKHIRGSVVTADALKVGGGMGKYEREGELSGLPAYLEGALYWEQWAGSGNKITEKWNDDYTKDFAGRGAWTTMMKKEKGIPFDLSLGFHSDAGTVQSDSIIGTLGIYTLLCDNSSKLPDGKSRYTCRSLTDLVQSQVVNDIRANYEPEWTRRELWDKSYSESRTTSVPGMLLELLSHQNFADMKYGLDPSFRFSVCRSVYKGILKFLSNLYGVHYTVQPLPVNSMAVEIMEGRIRISWKATVDPAEPTAGAKGFILQTREGNGAFDNGKILSEEEVKRDRDRYYTEVPVKAGRIYSFKVTAYNDGGKSFPSEILCAGLPGDSKEWVNRSRTVMVVNNFDRIAAPTWFDTPYYAGFDRATDSGVGYLSDISYAGNNYQTRRDLEWVDDDNCGFGASYTNMAGKTVPGNTFDFAYVHGKAIMDSGYAFYSVSNRAWEDNPGFGDCSFASDIICGKQVTTMVGRGAVENKYEVFPEALQEAIRNYTSRGGNILISGAHIGTDIWDQIYPIRIDSLKREAGKAFAENVLGWRRRCAFAGPEGQVGKAKMTGSTRAANFARNLSAEVFAFHNKINEDVYCAENVDGLAPASKKATTVMRYKGTNVSAAVYYSAESYNVLSIGFPLETIKDNNQLKEIISSALKSFNY